LIARRNYNRVNRQRGYNKSNPAQRPVVMDALKGALTKINKRLPDNYLKYNLRCFYYNHIRTPDPHPHAYYKNNSFNFRFKSGITIASYHAIIYEVKILVPAYIAKYKLQEGDVVLDCGAYVGAFTLYAARAVGCKGVVIAFEPDPVNYEKLISNIKLNNLTNVIAVNKGVWSNNTTLPFNARHDECAHVILEDSSGYNNKVSFVSVDSELETLGIHRVNFIKMDVEGSEIEAIRGASRVLDHNNVHLAIASYHEVNGKQASSEVESLLASNNYTAVTAFPEHPTTYAEKLSRGLLAV
jgi:FkbM family methyltransferase